jgi:hypothetical protein
VLRRVGRDVDQPEVPWPSILRQHLLAAMSRKVEKDMSTPGTNSMAVEALAIFQSTLVVDFADANQPGMDTMVIVLDTSGSMSDNVLDMGLGQADICRKMLNCRVVFMAADAEVYNAVTIHQHESLFGRIKQMRALKGGGGTDFRPAVAAGNKIRGARLILYFTDLMGEFPKESKVPVVWAAVERLKEQEEFKPPFGQIVWLTSYGVTPRKSNG